MNTDISNWSKVLAEKRNADLVLDNLEEIIIAHDLERKITFFNRAAEKLTGLRRGQVLGQDCHQVIKGGLCGSRCSFCRGCRPSFEPEKFPLSFTDAKGAEHRLEMTLLPITDAGGRLAGALASARDVTELTELRQALGRERSFRGMVGRHHLMQRVFELIREVSVTDFSVLLLGESGTGKELAAAAIHAESPRAGRPFVVVNCGAIPEGLLESELFGHLRGAFTGAVRDRRGRLELAQGGTVFLDEIGELSPAMQVKLLRVLQEKRFERVGSEDTITIDARFISATNRDLRALVQKGSFREDLFYRLCVVPIGLPPLRERRTDIPFLAEEFMDRLAVENRTSPPGISQPALEKLMLYRWPGNVRELINCLQYAWVMSRGALIEPRHLPLEVGGTASGKTGRAGRPAKISSETLAPLLEKNTSPQELARQLGVSRSTIYRHLKKTDRAG